jgi:hypothetical protein
MFDKSKDHVKWKIEKYILKEKFDMTSSSEKLSLQWIDQFYSDDYYLDGQFRINYTLFISNKKAKQKD